MRLFEILLLAVVFISLLFRFFRFEKWPWLHLFPWLTLLLGGYQLWFEDFRWQLIPLYFLAVFLIVASIPRIKNPANLPAKWASYVLIFIGIIAFLLPTLLPVPVFPEPTGPYAVGTTQFFWINEDQEEVYAPKTGTARRVMVQVWYPAALDGSETKAPYLPDGVINAQALSSTFGFPPFFLSQLALADSSAYLNPDLAACYEVWPVLVFSHGWRGMRYQNTAQMVELASQGYIVVAPEHAYGAVISVYPDGEIIYNKPEALPKGVSDEEYEKAARILGKSWISDLRFTLDQLEKLQSGEIPSMFTGHLDLEKLGMFGHSTGGGAVFETCWLDERCRAVFGEDPWLKPYDRQIPETGINQPSIMMFSEDWWLTGDLNLAETLWDNQPEGAILSWVKGTEHYDFSDMPLYSPIGHLVGLKGPIQPDREIILLNDYLLTFFNQHLLSAETAWPDLNENYPEVSFEEK